MDKPDPVEVASRIRAERTRLGLTLEQAAAATGVSFEGYRNLERSANPTYETLVALARAGFSARKIAAELFDSKNAKPAK